MQNIKNKWNVDMSSGCPGVQDLSSGCPERQVLKSRPVHFFSEKCVHLVNLNTNKFDTELSIKRTGCNKRTGGKILSK